MFYYFLYEKAGINLFQYITFRTVAAALTALLICLISGPSVISFLRNIKIRQTIRNDGPQSHLSKAGTPTMGGIIILFALISSTLLWAKLSNQYIWLVLAVTVIFGAIGFADDLRKILKHDHHGLSGKLRLFLETIVALTVGLFFYMKADFATTLAFPFFKNLVVDLGIFYLVLIFFIIVGSANAVNLTDGLDGLAIFLVMMVALTYGIFAYVAGHIIIADYLLIPYVIGAGELSVFCGAILGAGLGFLWFNSYPADIFMGDTGSLSLGGAIGVVAAVTKQELVLVIAGGLFVVEAMSVILQVLSFKMTGKRIFKMAPIHHHFELVGWPEPRVIVRFWIISIILMLAALSTLKLR